MNIGDKVRLMYGHEEGIITGIKDGNIIEVEIEDGFQIPVMRNEVVVISSDETNFFRKEPEPITKKEKRAQDEIIKPAKETISIRGIFLAFTEINDQKLVLTLINNTDLDLPFVVGEERDQFYTGVLGGYLQARNSVKIKEVSVQNFEKWPALILQLLFHKSGNTTLREPLIRKFNFKASTFFKSKKQAPILNKQAFLFQVDDTVSAQNPTTLDPQKIREKMLEPNTVESSSQESTNMRPVDVVDLHIENLTKDFAQMNNAEMLELQLQTFERKLDQAIAAGLDEITFIHGIGNGTLKNAIHKKVSGNADIKYFKDAMREKFGYGATLIKIK